MLDLFMKGFKLMTGFSDNAGHKNELLEWVKALLIAAGIVFLVRWLAFSPFIVDGDSMLPNFVNGERMIVNKLIYDFREPERGEVIIFLAPEGKDYIKRVIGEPGDRVRVDGDLVYINDKVISEPYIQEELDKAAQVGGIYNNRNYSVTEEVIVPEDSLFVLGDNRPRSKDSRFPDVGFVPFDKVVGRADLVYWPITEFRFVKHDKEVNP
jgi:signal peptidase I